MRWRRGKERSINCACTSSVQRKTIPARVVGYSPPTECYERKRYTTQAVFGRTPTVGWSACLCNPWTPLKSVAVGSLIVHWLDGLTSNVMPESGVWYAKYLQGGTRQNVDVQTSTSKITDGRKGRQAERETDAKRRRETLQKAPTRSEIRSMQQLFLGT